MPSATASHDGLFDDDGRRRQAALEMSRRARFTAPILLLPINTHSNSLPLIISPRITGQKMPIMLAAVLHAALFVGRRQFHITPRASGDAMQR